MMLYGAYALIVQHWIPWLILAWVWGGIFSVNMLMKEASMSRYPAWEAYKARTGMLLPWPFGGKKETPGASVERT
jgi:protein-S-isoprenylcysteine O-methyltransferase Ste14